VSHLGHGHRHGLDDRRRADRRALAVALALIVGLLVAEIAAGIVARSLALLADAGHMLTDAAALALALVAASLAGRPARGRWTFGLSRLEVLAAQANGITLGLVGVWIVYSAVRRLVHPAEVRGGIVLATALVGVAVSLAATAVLSRAQRDSLNVRAAFLHVATDLAAFAATAAAGALVLATGRDRFDPIASLLVAALLFWSSAGLLRESTSIFMEGSPGEIDPAAVGRALAGHVHVADVHDLHVWTVTSGFPALSAHVLVDQDADCHGIRRELESLLGDRFGLRHTTLQVDHVPDPRQSVELGAPFRREGPLERR
jgi:cobalt-zinc-cadmium efflux system protein